MYLERIILLFAEMDDINRLREILLEASEDSHKTRKAWIPTHYAHGIVALNHLGATENALENLFNGKLRLSYILSSLFR